MDDVSEVKKSKETTKCVIKRELTTYPYGTNASKVCESEMLIGKRFIL